MNVSTSAIQGNLDRIIKYLNRFSSFINCHMVNYLTDNHWKVFVPLEIQTEIQTKEDIEEAINLFWNDFECSQKSNLSTFSRFTAESRTFSLDYLTNTWLSSKEIVDVLHKLGCSMDELNRLQIKEFMSEKKNHEVSEMD